MPSKNRMTADKGDRQHESPESTHSYCNTEDKEKLKKKGPKLVLEVVLLFSQGGWAKQRPAWLSAWGRRRPAQMQDLEGGCGRGLPAASALPTSIAQSDTATITPLHAEEVNQLPPASCQPQAPGKGGRGRREHPQEGHKLC